MNTVVLDGFVNFVKSGVWDDGTAWCSFSLAHSSYAGKDDQGKTKYDKNYFNVKVRGPLAALAAETLDGDARRIVVSGTLRQRNYEDKNGENRQAVEIIATDISRVDSLRSFENREPASVASGGSSRYDDDEEPF